MSAEDYGGRSPPTRGVLVDPGYLLTCTFDSRGPSCVIEDPERGVEYRIDAFNRAAFLYAVLERIGSGNDGWVPCDQVAKAVWGKRASTNNVNTLVYRIRRELAAVGLESSFLEVKKGHVRLAAPLAGVRNDHALDVERLNTALTQCRAAVTEEELNRARRSLELAVQRVVLAEGLLLDPRVQT